MFRKKNLAVRLAGGALALSLMVGGSIANAYNDDKELPWIYNQNEDGIVEGSSENNYDERGYDDLSYDEKVLVDKFNAMINDQLDKLVTKIEIQNHKKFVGGGRFELNSSTGPFIAFECVVVKDKKTGSEYLQLSSDFGAGIVKLNPAKVSNSGVRELELDYIEHEDGAYSHWSSQAVIRDKKTNQDYLVTVTEYDIDIVNLN